MSKKPPKCPACDGLGYKVIGVPHQFITRKEYKSCPVIHGDPPQWVQIDKLYCRVCGKDFEDPSVYCSYPHIRCPMCNGSKTM